jgi:signal transduction histidine kinase
MTESVRMNDMIMKLLEITKYSSGAYEPARETFALRPFVQEWFDRNEALLEDKGITYENTVPENVFGNGDKLILESVLNNYLSNAVSHAEGEKRLRAYCSETETAWRVCIFNTGKPIAAKDIDKIWDSFYRADKSLSRSQGRFGLGLSIVAAIQDLHGEDYGVNNLLTGVEFWFDIKKAEKSVL